MKPFPLKTRPPSTVLHKTKDIFYEPIGRSNEYKNPLDQTSYFVNRFGLAVRR